MKFLKNNRHQNLSLFFLGVFFLHLGSATASALQTAAFQKEKSHSRETIKISQRQLIVNGTPFLMKGVCYHPVRKGQTIPDGLMTLHPTKKDLVTIEEDFKMMHEAGINTIRTYEPILDPHILNLLLKYHLRTIVPVCANCKTGLYDFSSTINTLKNHPSTLIWEIGNEWNYNFFYSTENGGSGAKGTVLNFKECVTLITELSAYIKTQDSMHPVSTDLGDLPKNHRGELASLFQSIDLCGINVYDGLTFGNRFQEWKALCDKPLYIGEYGADAFNMLTHSYDPKAQAVATRFLLAEIFKNSSANNPNNVLIGGCIFEWNDEWWKDPKGSPTTHDTGGFKVDHGGPYPDRYFNEEWFGVVDIDRHPRLAYEVMKKLFKPQSSH